MDRTTELALIDELLVLKAQKSPYLDPAVSTSPMAHYINPDHFEAEHKAVFNTQPQAVAHVSELADKGAFLRRDVGGLPVLITRDKEGKVNAFLNVCRHRGTRLVDEESGCRHRFSCPYHAWTYGSDGAFIGAPHLKDGFPGIDKKDLGLKRLAAEERFGLIWVNPSRSEDGAAAPDLHGMEQDIEALEIDKLAIAAEDRIIRKANWKILVEGGIEAYHFRVAHRTTIGPHFEDNLSSYKMFGDHMRSILPRTTMAKLTAESRANWHLRDHANILYTLFPNSQFLVLQDHLVWISSTPKAADETELRLVTLVPTEGPLAKGKDEAHWQQNHHITMTTLEEDFAIGESIQACAASGANDVMTFGRFEGALDQFNRSVTKLLEA